MLFVYEDGVGWREAIREERLRWNTLDPADRHPTVTPSGLYAFVRNSAGCHDRWRGLDHAPRSAPL